MQYYVYILQSLRYSSYYIGYTKDIQERIKKHNSALIGYTSRKQPWKLVYFEKHLTKREAIMREKFIKKQKSREFIEKLIQQDQK